MYRFFVAPECIQGTQVRVEGPVARQVARVLRLREGDAIVLLDDTGWEYVVMLQEVSLSRLGGEVVEGRRGRAEPSISLTLYQGVLKGDKVEMVLQKGTEIGASAFVPVLCRRSVPRASEGWADAKYPRWRRIIAEAAEQSGRARIPALAPPVPLSDALTQASGVRLLAWEGETRKGEAWEGDTKKGFREALLESMGRVKVEGLSLFVGPEGGFDPQEVEEARAAGVVVVGLGRRILRGETAGLVMAAAVMYQVGELGH